MILVQITGQKTPELAASFDPAGNPLKPGFVDYFDLESTPPKKSTASSIGQTQYKSYNSPMGHSAITGEPMTALTSWESSISAAFEYGLQDENMDFEAKSISMKDSSSKWRITSALQKSIRRGRVDDADTYAQALINGGQTEYLLQRLPVIAYEDIGLANPELVCKITLICRDQSVRAKFTVNRSLLWCARQLAASPKSRTLCDLTALMETAAPSVIRTPEEVMNSLRELYKMPADADMSLLVPVAAGIIHTSIKGATSRDALAQAMLKSGEVPPHIVYMFLTGGKKGVHDQHLYVPVVWQLFQQVTIIEKAFASEYLNNIPEEAYDMYTQEGKAAISYFRKSAGLESYTVEQVRIAVFLTDSALLNPVATNDRLLRLSGTLELQEMARTDTLGEQGALKLLAEVVSVEGREKLRHARKRVLGLVPSSKDTHA